MKEDIHVKVNTEIMRDVRAWATSHGISLAAAVSILLSIGLEESKS